MSTPNAEERPQTPGATAALAQTREAAPPEGVDPATVKCPGEGEEFVVGAGVTRAVHGRPYERKTGEPIYRPLRIYTLDPAESRLEGAVATVNVPYEPLQPGPRGELFEVDPVNHVTGERYRSADLESPSVLIRSGADPSPADPCFHQQMVYAVCSTVYASFRQALGRHPSWGFRAAELSVGGRTRLRIVPHAFEGENAFYDPERGELAFGYYRVEGTPRGRNVPEGWVFTCLSHDVVAHEVTHALLDGLRAHFTMPTRPDVLAFHEAFADLVALFQHFSYRDVVRAAIRKSRGKLDRARLLTDLARQFGHTQGGNEKKGDTPERALRTAVQINERGELVRPRYHPALPKYEMASVLVSAVFEAFTTLFKRRTERFVRLATGGTGVLSDDAELSADLQEVLAKEASELANQFLTLCIRAIDYCPPVDLELGEYLRAVITADRDVVPDDPYAYREAWVDAFAAHGIYPRGVSSLHEDSLLWRAPITRIPTATELSFSALRFSGDPARPASVGELRRQACALGHIVSRPENLWEFGLAAPGDPALEGDTVDLPCVQSIRSSRRVGPDGQVVFDLVAEVTQTRTVRRDGEEFTFPGGSTVILGPDGDVRYVVGKGILNERRLETQIAYTRGEGQSLWQLTDGRWKANPNAFRLLHDEKARGKG